jgi:predicted  nucleic acid-binding Zn-ribbon protein
MSPDLERLIKLQHLESRIAEARASIAAYPQRLADADARLHEATTAVEATRQRLKDNHDARRALEKDAAVYQARLAKFKDQLSAVKTNREYQAMQHEIETAQKELGAAEEKVLERMVDDDQLAIDVKQAESALTTLRKEIEAEKKSLAEELASTEGDLQRGTEARAALVKDTAPQVMVLFEHLVKARKGVAICSATRDGLCSVCHVRLRPPVFQQIRHNDTIVQCESCQRILYWVPPPPPIEHPIVRT